MAQTVSRKRPRLAGRERRANGAGRARDCYTPQHLQRPRQRRSRDAGQNQQTGRRLPVAPWRSGRGTGLAIELDMGGDSQRKEGPGKNESSGELQRPGETDCRVLFIYLFFLRVAKQENCLPAAKELGQPLWTEVENKQKEKEGQRGRGGKSDCGSSRAPNSKAKQSQNKQGPVSSREDFRRAVA